MERPKSGWDAHDAISEASLTEAERRLAGLDLKLVDNFPTNESDTITPNEIDYIVEKPPVVTDPTTPQESQVEVITDILQSTAEENAPRITRSDGERVEEITKFKNNVPVSEFQISELPTDINVGKHAFTPTPSPEQRAAEAAKPKEKGFWGKLFGG
ncbi:hypothetical protein A3I99_02615 [Candidatus Kaiserbacteria bacterium RIFCSPLOWO2_02_FULL_45_11b]|uniref:Uncharacterized protein n=1 Tax=Candidatus Kaiserbacteria bacterium RIFCSPLOWO2_12_FULL_45_26 TaxID=1798525 RepID=A0A1F6FFA4_9BACT|nr:MAG: hypothetical protein A2Z56_01805 [Candidatus Kaiserbacteria bacterium RIFCSPHIGHO2_12_45_16]OGG70278.1 MAG: hypothetical protein A2929_04360 [Candidatus Kaiserbacteria bacterium RIFCSPLOWO2_01_FULL_45_25]OGG81946.1 MAG: hypothetical protein A3I99_02615 [Candidatus Kaiserbacteria bacterium RIFCSPLOWO2_02_FULL_45_11b]OGG84542.1 MAG: hypothetical protein A3G90_00405 [Candidatus Kaiserbacteria bacterium RIFCSPLOWO2_12_FULL_45_26]